jgi:hypothetical protein
MGEDNENLYPFGMASCIKYRLRAASEKRTVAGKVIGQKPLAAV